MGNWCWRIELVKLQALLKNRALALHQTAHLYGTNLKLKFCLDFLGMIPCFDYLFVLPQPEMRVRRHLQQPGWSWGLTARSWDLHGHVTDHLSALSTSLGSILRTEGRDHWMLTSVMDAARIWYFRNKKETVFSLKSRSGKQFMWTYCWSQSNIILDFVPLLGTVAF